MIAVLSSYVIEPSASFDVDPGAATNRIRERRKRGRPRKVRAPRVKSQPIEPTYRQPKNREKGVRTACVSFSPTALADVDRAALALKLSRSAFLAFAARIAISHLDVETVRAFELEATR